MAQLDWIVLIGVLVFIVLYGLWKTRKLRTAEEFLVGGRKSPWWLVGVSIMATQASAITFLSTPGQAYNDGMGFVQFYLGLPIAMIILCIFVLPRYFKMNVYTAYEYLEGRFGLPTRVLTAILFLIQRGLAAGITIFAPAIILSSILGWNLTYTNIIIGILVIVYTLIGGTEAVSQTQKQQMAVIFLGMFVAFFMIVKALPMNMGEALHLTGQMGKLEVVDFQFDPNSRYNIWSALLGGTFLFLSYFGTDQSQVQRYLSGKDAAQAKMGLMFNALFKVPMQFFILLVGIMVFAFFQFNQSPLNFNPEAQAYLEQQPGYTEQQQQYDAIFEEKQSAILSWKAARDGGDQTAEKAAMATIQAANASELELRKAVKEQIDSSDMDIESNDKDYVFINYILNYLPHGLIGLLLAVILSAAMSSTSSELNALATTTVVDIYKRSFAPNISDQQYLNASRVFTFIWGCIAIFFAVKASLFENLIQAVNIIGSLFYGVILGVFAVAFLFPKIKGWPVLVAILLVEPLVVWLYFLNEWGHIKLQFLWLNPIGCLGLIIVAHLLQPFFFQPNKKLA
ncbi:MAG: sodium:solute symporter [Saprospiraceae bacterium]|nr:sodium:solute symporter [Saprospiraceae bacterium]